MTLLRAQRLERPNAAVGYPTHESDGYADEETDNLGLWAEPPTEVPEMSKL